MVLAALRILSGPGEALLNADETEFARALYGALWRAGGGGGAAPADGALALLSSQAVTALLLSRREYSTVRAAAFAKRLLQVALGVSSPSEVLPLLSVVRALCHRYRKVADALLAPPPASGALSFPSSSFGGGGGGGASNAAATAAATARYGAPLTALVDGDWAVVNDPDAGGVAGAGTAVNASLGGAASAASTAWELAALQTHYHPVVAAFAVGTARLAASTPQTAPAVLAAAYDDSTGTFNPPPVLPKKHPLAARVERAAAAGGGGGEEEEGGGSGDDGDDLNGLSGGQGGGSEIDGDDDDDNDVDDDDEFDAAAAAAAVARGGGAASSSSSNGSGRLSSRQRRRAKASLSLHIRPPAGAETTPAAWFWAEVAGCAPFAALQQQG